MRTRNDLLVHKGVYLTVAGIIFGECVNVIEGWTGYPGVQIAMRRLRSGRGGSGVEVTAEPEWNGWWADNTGFHYIITILAGLCNAPMLG